jgi:hypothetical protein
LDALKKADREAAAERSGNTPWAKDASLQVPVRNHRWHWWAGAGVAVCLTVAGFFFLNPDIVEKPPQESLAKNQPAPIQKRTQSPQIGPAAPAPISPPAENGQWVKKIPQGEESKIPRQPEKEPLDPSISLPERQPDPTPLKSKTAKEPTLESMNAQHRTAEMRSPSQPSEPIADTADASNRTVGPQPDKRDSVQEEQPVLEEKNFRKDPRIDLQALVWAEASEDRFVVINNQLIREGGAIDTIVVEEINPDDVKLAEGNEKWYEVFQIR